MELSFPGMRKTGQRRWSSYSQELSLGHAKFKAIGNPRFASVYEHSSYTYPESLGFVLQLDRISCMLLK